jgi:DNA-binding winged helix-turn-helix (wHTH) protein/tetratricopeptide (TPR) repeat protein
MSSLSKPVYRFAGFTLEPAERRLSAAGKPIALTPKVFDTLVLLVERAGHIVSKDQLMKELWPRGYVDESNLTKHIWLIRRALGESETESRLIETVPKVGYRFIAPVSTGAEAPLSALGPTPTADATSPQPAAALPGMAVSARRRWLSARSWGVAASAVAMSVLLGMGWRLLVGPRFAHAPSSGHRGYTIALIGFSNLSRNPKDAWLAPALSEMLGTEFSMARNVQVIPDELVRDARSDLPAPTAGGYSAATLARLHRRLDADYVISGSYLVAGSTDDAPLRVDIALQDTRTGALVASVSEQTEVSGVIALATQSGATLRRKLGVGPPETGTPGLIANARPPNLDVARRLGFALDALRQYDAARARDELLEAVAEAPGYAPAYSLLAQAWSALGFRAKALAAAGQAEQNSAYLPREQRLQIEAVADSSRSEWSKAAAAWGALVHARPDSIEYRLQAIDADIAAGSMPGAQTMLRDLERLPNAAGDPRVELAAARVAAALDDPRASEQHAAEALRLAQRRDAAGLIADAQLALAGARTHLNENEEARASLVAAIAAYRSIRNPRGEAAARTDLALALSNLNRNQEAREEYERALELDRGIGDLAGVAAIYRNLCSMLWVAGDRDGAQAAARHSLELARETGDLTMQAWNLQALATIASDESAGDEVLAEYREVVALDTRAGHQTAWPLANIADVQRLRGELDAARATCARALAEAATLSDPQFAVFSGFVCALIESDRGDAAGARAGFEEVIRRVGSGGDTTYRDNSLMMIAQLDMDEGRWSAARERLERASQGFAAAEVRTGEADADAMLALCAQTLGDTAARDRALQRARTLRRSMTSRQEVYVVDIAMARLDDAAHSGPSAAERLLILAADAERRHWMGWALEAKLVAWQLLRARHTARAQALYRDIDETAQRQGFGRILMLLKHPVGAASSAMRELRAQGSRNARSFG